VLKAMVWSRTAALNMSKIRNFTQEYDNLFCGRVLRNVCVSLDVRALYANLFRRVSRAVEKIETGHEPPASCQFDVSRLATGKNFRTIRFTRSETYFGPRRYYKLMTHISLVTFLCLVRVLGPLNCWTW